MQQEKHNKSGVAVAVLQLQILKLLLGVCFIFKALFEHARILPVAAFIAFQVCSFIFSRESCLASVCVDFPALGRGLIYSISSAASVGF